MESVRSRLRGSLPKSSIISEADVDYEKRASPGQLAAIRRAEGASGVVPVDPDWERKATPEQREARRQESLRREQKADESEVTRVGDIIIAKYKIEVTFTHCRRLNAPNACGIQVWESGKRFHGGGDQLMFVCTDTTEKDPAKQLGCKNFISADDITRGVAYCRHCQKGIVAEKLGQIYYMNETPAKIAVRLVEMFRKLGSNADIYLKFHKTDIRYIAMERAKGLETARRLKGMHIYPLKNILRDTIAGADLGQRFKVFLTS